MNVSIIGKSSYVGSHFYRHLSQKHPKVIGTSREPSSPSYLDLLEPQVDFLEDQPEIQYAIICAANPNINFCEQHPKKSFLVNVLGPLNLIRKLAEKKVKPIIFSSDVVFDGSQPQYDEDSPKSPINDYGTQKAILEDLVPKITDDYLILRLSKTYSVNQPDSTLIFDLMQKVKEQKPFQAADDLVFNPISIEDVIRATEHLILNNCNGLYNVTGTETTSWYKLAVSLASELGLDDSLIERVSIDQFSAGAKRAKNLNVKPKRIKKEFPSFNFTPLMCNIKAIVQNSYLEIG